MFDVLMLSVCDCNRVEPISDVYKSWFLKEFNSL